MQDPRKLLVWQKSHRLAVDIHRLTERWSRRDHGALISQSRRAALSIPSNICEGCGRETKADLARFLQIAIGSADELEYQIEFAGEIGLLPSAVSGETRSRIIEIRRMLIGLRRRVKAT